MPLLGPVKKPYIVQLQRESKNPGCQTLGPGHSGSPRVLTWKHTTTAKGWLVSAVELRDEVYSTRTPRDGIVGMSTAWDYVLKETSRVASSARRKSWESACYFGPRAPRV